MQEPSQRRGYLYGARVPGGERRETNKEVGSVGWVELL